MMKGKKFNAAERHFEKLKLKYEKQIKELLERAERDHGEIRYYRRKSESAERENEELKNWIERLLEYTELSQDDIRQACEKDKKMAEVAERIRMWGNFLG